MYSDMAAAINGLKDLIHKSVSIGLVACSVHSTLVTSISSIDWSQRVRPKESKCSEYVRSVSHSMTILHGELSKNVGRLPKEVLEKVWKQCVESLYELLLETYITVGVCNMNGRSQMVSDLEGFVLDGVDEGKERVLRYLQAFYISRESDVNDWIRKNQRKYSQEQLDYLRGAVVHNE